MLLTNLFGLSKGGYYQISFKSKSPLPFENKID